MQLEGEEVLTLPVVDLRGWFKLSLLLPQHYSMLHLCFYHKTVFRPHLISSLRAFQMIIY